MKTTRARWGLASAAALVTGLVLTAAAAPLSSPVERQGAEVRILAYNIRHGAGMDDSVDLRRAAAVINELAPDLVALQEIDSATSRTGLVDQAAALGESTGLHAVFGEFMAYRGGKYGMALLSRRPFLATENHRLPDGREPRSALAARVAIGDAGPELVFVGIHLYATEEERYAQAERLVEIFEGQSAPVVLAGDFNSRPDSPVMALLGRSWSIPDKGEDRMTFPSDAPDREIDYILLRPGRRFEVVEYRLIDEPMASDHRPVFMRVRVRPS